MNTGVMAAAGTGAVKSVLDKPLHELTEDDISQLTREDCRRYLKEKGMRRPSWNKSQAIQQVISLKSLLEPNPPNSAAKAAVCVPEFPPHLPPTTTVTSNSSSSVKELSPADIDGSMSALAEDGGASRPEGSSASGSDLARQGECRPVAVNAETLPVRSADEPHLPVGQMTIFYSGKVNVYDGVPVDKAQAIMHLAASPIQAFQDEPSSGNSIHRSTSCQLPASGFTFNLATPDAPIVPSTITGKVTEHIQHCRSDGNTLHEQDIEGQTSRQVSLQRYFEKRKDRGKFKTRRKVGSSSSGLEVYLNNQTTPAINGIPTQSNTTSPSQLGILQRGEGEMHKPLKKPGVSLDLNDKA